MAHHSLSGTQFWVMEMQSRDRAANSHRSVAVNAHVHVTNQHNLAPVNGKYCTTESKVTSVIQS